MSGEDTVADAATAAAAVGTTAGPPDVLRVRDVGLDAVAAVLAPAGLRLVPVADGAPIPGSHWGDDEAGLIGHELHVRSDTPVHSALHEGCHWLLMSPERRARLHTDAGGTAVEESAVCVLQILLAERVAGVTRARVLADMDAWGYSFRLGSTAAWFARDADDARALLADRAARYAPVSAGIDPQDRRVPDEPADGAPDGGTR